MKRLRLNKDGSPDKRYNAAHKVIQPVVVEQIKKEPIITIVEKLLPKDPQELLNSLLEQNNLQLDFDVVNGALPTKYGIIKLEKPTLVVKASYVNR